MVVRLLRVYVVLLSGVVLVLATTGCGSAGTSLSSSDNGRTVVVHPNDEIVLTLDENPSTGYTWSIDQIDDSVLTLTSSKYQGGPIQLPGSGGVHTFTFTATHAGTSPLSLKQWRSWEGDSSVVARFAVSFQVQ